jgi:hypothetical protein|nr:MAG TPA: hypothetical protein [Caudoviricetes sp.]
MNKQHNPISYKVGRTLAYLLIALAAILLITGSVALLKLLIGFILA